MGGSGLIVAVIVAAWALFLVPQWMHRRAAAAAHLADRLPDGTDHDEALESLETSETDEPSDAARGSGSQRRSRFGRRQLARRPRSDAAPHRKRLRFGGLGSSRSRATTLTDGSSTPARSAAARRRRVVVVLAVATLLTSIAVGAGTLLSLPVPAWLVAVPGGLLVAYLVLLAVLRPGATASTSSGARPTRAPVMTDVRRDVVDTAASERVEEEPAGARGGDAVPAAATSNVGADRPTINASTWTPVPVPTPTYVTAPRARRSVRTIDLSNPGSWTGSVTTGPAAAAVAAPSAGYDGVEEADETVVVEHRRAVGD